MSVEIADHQVGTVDNTCNQCGQDRRFAKCLKTSWTTQQTPGQLGFHLVSKSNQINSKQKQNHSMLLSAVQVTFLQARHKDPASEVHNWSPSYVDRTLGNYFINGQKCGQWSV